MTTPPRKKGRGPARASEADHERLEYPTIRDQFLASYREAKDEAVWLVEVGKFVQHCWLAEEHERHKSGTSELDEIKLWHCWDQCSQGQLEDIRTKAALALDEHARKVAVQSLLRTTASRIKPIGWLVQSLSWVSKEVVRGFVGGVGLILLGLLFVWVAPHLAKCIRHALDEALPVSTQPHQ